MKTLFLEKPVSQRRCLQYLEQLRWPSGPTCPYCFSVHQIIRDKRTHRHHCNTCNTSFSVTVNTIFHDTKLPLEKWFLALSVIRVEPDKITVKQLQKVLSVTYKTAWYLRMRVRRALVDQPEFVEGISKFFDGRKNI